MKTLLITGCCGMLGAYAMKYFAKEYKVYGIDLMAGREYNLFTVDITNHDAVEEVFKNIHPDIVLHTAAVISPEECEDKPDLAYKVNAESTGNIAYMCEKYNARMVYISTNMVFDGKLNRPYTEQDETRFVNNYGYSKLMGEKDVEKYCKDYAIVRTNIYGWKVGSFGEWLYTGLKNNKAIRLYKNLYFNCIYIGDFCFYLKFLMASKLVGTWNLTSTNYMSKYKFAQMMNNKINHPNYVIVDNQIKYKQKNFIVKRPLKAVLDCGKYEKDFVRLPTMEESLVNFLKDGPGLI